MSEYSYIAIILFILIGGFLSYYADMILRKYGMASYILFFTILVILIYIAQLIYYKGNLPPKKPPPPKRRLPLNHPLFITAIIIGISSLILLNTLYK